MPTCGNNSSVFCRDICSAIINAVLTALFAPVIRAFFTPVLRALFAPVARAMQRMPAVPGTSCVSTLECEWYKTFTESQSVTDKPNAGVVLRRKAESVAEGIYVD